MHHVRFILIICAFLATATAPAEAQALPDSVVTYYGKPNGDSTAFFKIANEFNSSGQLVSHSIYFWNVGHNRWVPNIFPVEECIGCNGRYEYEYNSLGQKIIVRSYRPGMNEDWQIGGISDFGYDDSGNLVSSRFSAWDESLQTGKPLYATEWQFDPFHHKTSETYYGFIDSLQTWQPLDQTLYQYDSAGRKIFQGYRRWDQASRDWLNRDKTEWVYDDAGIETNYTSYRWMFTLGEWQWKINNEYKLVNEYDTTGNKTSALLYQKVSTTRWSVIQKELLTYDDHGRMTLDVIYKGTGLPEDFRDEREYGTDGKLIRQILTGHFTDRWEGLNVVGDSRIIKTYDADGNLRCADWNGWDIETQSFRPSGKDYYFYPGQSTGIRNVSISGIRLYPNPTSGILILDGADRPVSVKVFSLNGMLLKHFERVTGRIDLGDLSTDAYLLVIEDEKGIIQRKIVVRQ